MKRNALLAIGIGLILIGASVFAALNMLAPSQQSSGNTTGVTTSALPTATPPPEKTPTTTDVLEKFSLLKDKVLGTGHKFGGGATQMIMGEETALVYVYKQYGQNDISDLLAAGFTSVHEVFDTKDPLMVGVVDTSQLINEQTFKVDIYALERTMVDQYLLGDITKTELAQKALLVTPETESLHPNNSSLKISKNIYNGEGRKGSFTEPASRTQFFVETLNQSGYLRPISLQEGTIADERVVSVVMALKRNATAEDIYNEIEAALRACAGSYGDYDKFYISLIPPAEGFNDYYTIDARAAPVMDYFDGKISQYQLYNNINLTYYTK
ncbi:hypothetical protein [Methanocella arvoryzae]|uniref:Uncharacterized protein n=1 Tax=Methanocella arvoryzae (strain DSM 22066 / NBRC 105507 / MRE50) TaxID=351160 RepID=Q0W6P7_METAR|nr:hypothetical protein [Methanocella arvoryzae]CAJ35946.1 hypothetical protein RCIX526 [Methanocella arvoryzae MRE50]